jgi:ketosteroid isomerase-like protein
MLPLSSAGAAANFLLTSAGGRISLMNAFTLVAFVALLAPLTGFAATPSSKSMVASPDKDKLKAELVQVEKAFSDMAQAKGILAAFEHFAAPDVAFIDTDPRKYRGVEAVRQRMGNTPPGTKLSWSPTFTEVSDDGTLGYNYGRYEARAKTPEGEDVIRTGFFLTIWKRQPDGMWKYVMDTGAPDRPPQLEKKK